MLQTLNNVWNAVVTPSLPVPLNYVPLIFRLLAVMVAAPFALFMALELIAYVITRTLHISMSNLRVPRSPLTAPRDLDDDNPIAAKLDTSDPDKSEQPFDRAFSKASRRSFLPPVLLPTLVLVSALALHVLSSVSTRTTADLAAAAGLAKPVAMIVTAHPDDEAMFFAPTVLNLLAAGWGVYALCMSTGNADGLGSTRAREVVKSYMQLGVPAANVRVVDNPAIQDSMDAAAGAWDPKIVAEFVAPLIKESGATHLITFDAAGVTGHPNHVALSAVHAALPNKAAVRLLRLHSPSIATKFLGPMYALFAASRAYLAPAEEKAMVKTLLASPRQYVSAVQAMLAHRSQLVWFRWLYVSFSHLMWVNELIEG